MGGHQGLSYDPKTVSQFQNPGVPYQVSNPPSGEGTSFPNGYKEALLPYRNDDIEAYLQTLKGYPGKTGDVPGRDVWETGGPAFDKAMQAKQAAQPQSYQGFNFPASMLQQMVPYPSNPAPSNPAPSSPAVNNAAQSQAAQPNQASPMNLKNEFLKFLGLIK